MTPWNCRHCCSLPQLGQLPALKELFVGGVDMLERIGHEFYCGGSSSMTRPFKSLQVLQLSNMPSWKEWLLMEAGGQEDGPFFELGNLTLINCPKLSTAYLPGNLPSLKHVAISGCSGLGIPDPDCSNVTLVLKGCPQVVSFPEGRLPSNVHTIHIRECRILVSLKRDGLRI